MSLVGSLEDLGLGDILQIVSLARKSGRLLLRTDGQAGRIVVLEGMVRGAAIKGEPEDLRGLVVASCYEDGDQRLVHTVTYQAERTGQGLTVVLWRQDVAE